MAGGAEVSRVDELIAAEKARRIPQSEPCGGPLVCEKCEWADEAVRCVRDGRSPVEAMRHWAAMEHR
jgi:hypothetical protein